MKEDINKLLILSYLTSLDLNYSKKIIQKIYHKSILEIEGMTSDDTFVFMCKKLIHRLKNVNLISIEKFQSEWISSVFSDDVSIDIQHWYELYKDSSVDERKAFILSQVLKLNDSTIADILGVSVGTIRYRTSSCYQKISRSIKYA